MKRASNADTAAKPKRKRPRQMTVNHVMRIKGCDQDFGLGPGVIAKCKVVYKDTRGKGFDNPTLQLSFMDIQDEMVKDTIEFQALVKRPPPELVGKGKKVE